MIDDRKLLFALLEMVGALAEKLTGAVMLVEIEGTKFYFGHSVTWEETASADDPPGARAATCSLTRDAADATPKWHG